MGLQLDNAYKRKSLTNYIQKENSDITYNRFRIKKYRIIVVISVLESIFN